MNAPEDETVHSRLGVQPVTAADGVRAEELARALDLPLIKNGADLSLVDHVAAILLVHGVQLSLVQTGPSAPGPVGVDFGSGRMRHRRRSGANELLGRAVGVGRRESLRVIDATAGLGRDAFVLADLGCEVQMWERHPAVAAMLQAGVSAAQHSEEAWLRTVSERLRLRQGDVSRSKLAEATYDVVYLDPMFPASSKRAAVKKDMAIFQVLHGDTDAQAEADELLRWALDQPVARVVLKRPLKAPASGTPAPSHCIRGKAVRYDVWVLRDFA